MKTTEECQVEVRQIPMALIALIQLRFILDGEEKVLAVNWELRRLSEGDVESPDFSRTDIEGTHEQRTAYVRVLRLLARTLNFSEVAIGRRDIGGFLSDAVESARLKGMMLYRVN